jgi:DNA-directed RNA polymerase specialized sigma24 family protein
LSQRQIAELLDVPETTVETRLARGRRMLRQLLSEQESGAAIGVVPVRSKGATP